jgi:brefeldin A-inhibited guanine nucleotide-exchange protein
MRSKLLALHLLHSILSSHSHIFFAPAAILFPVGTLPESTMFVHSVKQYLCLALSRNAVSVVPQVFEISLDLFGRVLVGLRSVMKVSVSRFIYRDDFMNAI